MVRRTREEAEATRQALLDTALELFSRHGAEAVTLKQIAAQAGVTHGAMYWHFRNKGDLLVQLYHQSELPFEPHYLEQRQAVQQDALTALRAFVLNSLSQLGKDPRAHRIYRLFHYGRACSPELEVLREAIDAELESWREHLHYFLKQARKQKQIRKKADLDQISMGLLAMIVGLLDLWTLTPDTFALAIQAKGLLDVQLAGLRK